MSKILSISPEEIVEQIKLSCQLPSIAKEIASRKIIFDTAAKAGIEVEIEELQHSADKIRLANQLYSTDDTWHWLNERGLSLEDFEEIARYNLISDKLAKHLFADKVEPFFVEHQLDYTKAVIYEVVLEDEDLAMELYFALSEGEISFYEVASQYAQKPQFRRTGGYRGIFSRRQLKPEISAAVFAAAPPKILKPIVSSQGVHLILVEEIIQPSLDEQMRQKILADLFAVWIKQKIAQTKIVSPKLDNSQQLTAVNA